ncbi:MAG: hypothetical protein RI935_524 [Candidatus Parcubacteria bacterium]|jgi:protein-disulfide isomerase
MNTHLESADTQPETSEDIKTLSIKRHKPFLTTPIAIIIAAIILGMSHILYAIIIEGKSSSDTTYFLGSSLGENSYATGNIKSDVLVVEYSDTECPFCARLYPTMSEIQRNYSDKVAFDYRHFPLTSIHPNAFGEAVAIECIGQELGAAKRREYIDRLFSYKINNNSMKLPNGAKEALAKDVGANATTFASCLSQQTSSDIVNAYIADGIQAGVSGTPATFVLKRNGDRYEQIAAIEGAREYAYIEAAILSALKK